MSKIILTEESGTPSTPATGKWTVFSKSDGLYILDDAGTVYGPFATLTTTDMRYPRKYAGKTVAPTINDDSGDGYAVGDRWLDETSDKEYVALDVTVGSAVWVETTASASGANNALSNLASVAINTDLISDTNEEDDLGSSAKRWDEGHIRKVVADVISEAAQGDKITVETFAQLDKCTGGTASASSYSTSEYLPDNAFDNDLSTRWLSLESSGLPAWIEYNLGAGNGIIAIKYRLNYNNTNVVRAPKDFKFQGYNGTGWDDLDTQTGITWTEGVWKEFSFSNTTSYERYRIYITAVGDSTPKASLSQAEIMDAAQLATTATIVNGKVGIGETDPDNILELGSGDGNMIADGYDTHSLSEYKLDIANAPKTLERLAKVNPKTWVNKKNKQAKFGLVADDKVLKAELPELIAHNSQGLPSGISLDAYVAFLHQAVIELNEQVQILSAKKQ
ncbi:MAG: hypothetical protein B5M51_02520 [Anaerolinea sp. 4484_236]|nr:MAG: hypothetical protein B5M51_02520 [Anaerolinea sp. 4484_236]